MYELQATYGIRIYLPDGSPGQTSVNDWHENYNELALQNGRWYPSAMIMANGSILVMGGEDGSNGKAIPTLELLPKVGGVITQDFLQRTDPYNVYWRHLHFVSITTNLLAALSVPHRAAIWRHIGCVSVFFPVVSSL
jgi:hypothetical protein